MRCQLAGIKLREADLMLTDEPTDFLDLSGILEGYLKNLHETTNCTIVVVWHDRTFNENICDENSRPEGSVTQLPPRQTFRTRTRFPDLKVYTARMKEAFDRQTAKSKQTIAQKISLGKKTGDTNRL